MMLVMLVMLVMVRMTPPTEIEKNDNDLLKYIYEIGDKKYVEIGKNLSAVESLRGGQNSFNLEKENVMGTECERLSSSGGSLCY